MTTAEVRMIYMLWQRSLSADLGDEVNGPLLLLRKHCQLFPGAGLGRFCNSEDCRPLFVSLLFDLIESC